MIPFPRHQSAVPDYNENGDMTKARLLEIRRRMIEIYDATPELQHLPRPELEVGFKEAVSARRAAKKKKKQPGVESVKSSGYGQGIPTRPKNRHALSPGGTAKKAAAAGAGGGKKKKRAPATRQQQQQRRPFSPASARGGQSRRRDVL